MNIQKRLQKNYLQLRANNLSWFSEFTSHLSIGNKIICGYTLALSIAVLGTFAGLIVGNYWEKQAKLEAEEWHQTGVIL